MSATEINFKDYWTGLTPRDKSQLADRLHTSVSTLSQYAHGHRNPSKRFVDLARIVTGVFLEFPSCCED